MESTPSFFRIFSAYSKTCFAGNTSEYLSVGDAGHFRFIGGIFDAAYNRLFLLRPMIFPSNASLLPSPYAQAVSKKLTPKLTASCMASSDCSSSDPLHPLMPQSPSAIYLTSKHEPRTW